jgi:hypothetical protein
MTTLLIHSVAAGLLLAVACGDARGTADTRGRAKAAMPSPTRGAATPADLCSLVTEEEAEAILGKKLEPPQRQTGGDSGTYVRGGMTSEPWN